MQSINRIVQIVNWSFRLCIPLAIFCFAGAFMVGTELPRLKRLDSELREIQGRLASTELRFIPYSANGKRKSYSIESSKEGVEFTQHEGYWCAMGKFEIDKCELKQFEGMSAEGSLSAVSPGTPTRKWLPTYSQERAASDAKRWTIGKTYRAWVYFDQPTYVLVSRPYLAVLAQRNYAILAGAGLLGVFACRVLFGWVLKRNSGHEMIDRR